MEVDKYGMRVTPSSDSGEMVTCEDPKTGEIIVCRRGERPTGYVEKMSRPQPKSGRGPTNWSQVFLLVVLICSPFLFLLVFAVVGSMIETVEQPEYQDRETTAAVKHQRALDEDDPETEDAVEYLRKSDRKELSKSEYRRLLKSFKNRFPQYSYDVIAGYSMKAGLMCREEYGLYTEASDGLRKIVSYIESHPNDKTIEPETFFAEWVMKERCE